MWLVQRHNLILLNSEKDLHHAPLRNKFLNLYFGVVMIFVITDKYILYKRRGVRFLQEYTFIFSQGWPTYIHVTLVVQKYQRYAWCFMAILTRYRHNFLLKRGAHKKCSFLGNPIGILTYYESTDTFLLQWKDVF